MSPTTACPITPGPQTQARLTPLGAGIPWRELSTNGNNCWGNCQQAIIDGGAFSYALWGDNRDGTNLTRLFGVKFNE